MIIEGHTKIDKPGNIPSWDVDPYDLSVLTDPNPYYTALREQGELVYLSKYNVLAVGRYEVTKRVFSDHKNFVSSKGVGMMDISLEGRWRPASIILEVDPPYHTRTRKVMALTMSPKVVKQLAGSFEEIANKVVDNILERGTFDAVEDFAEVFPTIVFPRAVGMLDVNKRHLIDYGAMVFNSVGPDNELSRMGQKRISEIVPWITAACGRDRITDDGIGAQLYGFADKGEITHDEAALLMRSFLSAGIDTTVTSIGNAMWCFAKHPDQWEVLKSDHSLIKPAFEEILRYTSPVHTFFRTAGRDTEIAGVPVVEGTKISCALGAANLDPDKWGHDAHEFKIDRRPRGHLAFGTGIHGCVGQNIARGEMHAVLSAMVQKVDKISFAGTPEWRPNNSMRALDKLAIEVTPR